MPNSPPSPPSVLERVRCPRLVVTLVVLAVAFSSTPLCGEDPLTSSDREHWSFRPLQRPQLPVERSSSWGATAIDQFFLSAWQRKDLEPLPRADRATLLRRLCFDLWGLPPTPAQLHEFQNDSSPDAYPRLVDRLLSSPRFGERWAQHWLDLARFAETDGFEHDKVRGQAWRYRDWVVDALNNDLPYDRFVAWQIAGDELSNDPDASTATAFCLAGPDMPDINLQEERRHYLLNEMTSSVSSVFLALQMECAQCHDHKYDPISQADFYRLRAVFEPAVHVERDKSVGTLHESGTPPTASHIMLRGDFRRPGPIVEPAFPRIANPNEDAFEPRPTSNSSGRRASLALWLTRGDHPLTARVIVNRVWQFHFGSGLSETPSDFGILGDEPVMIELLDWLAAELVNNGWSLKQLHRLIVTSEVYQLASYPDRQADAGEQDRWRRVTESDPTNLYFSRFPRQRLSGEVTRDAMLQIANVLNLQQGGPGVLPPLPDELVSTLLKNQWKVSEKQADHNRRSVYIFARRNLRYPIFDVFDRPDANASCPQRSESTTAIQSLLMLNSDFSFEMARRLAGRVLAEVAPQADAQVERVVQLVYNRAPTSEEHRRFTAFLQQHAGQLATEQRSAEDLALPLPCPAEADVFAAAALTDLALALLNSNQFLYVD